MNAKHGRFPAPFCSRAVKKHPKGLVPLSMECDDGLPVFEHGNGRIPAIDACIYLAEQVRACDRARSRPKFLTDHPPRLFVVCPPRRVDGSASKMAIALPSYFNLIKITWNT